MQTRRQTAENKQFRPDAFASSVEYDRGLLGNQLAARCQKLSDPEEIALLWWLQQLSWRDGGLEKFAAEFLRANRAKVGTATMHKIGTRAGQIYNADQVREARKSLCGMHHYFPLRGEHYQVSGLESLADTDYYQRVTAEERAIAREYPTSYAAADFVDALASSETGFVNALHQALVDPASPSLRAGLWFMPGLWDALLEWQQREIEASRGQIVETQITRTVFEELDFALHSHSFILIEGREGVGKTEAAKNWCAQHPGQAVYVRLESGTDEATLYRSIARAIGTACSYGRKATEMKLRIQDALQPGQIMLVLDEAHFLWPQSDRSARSAPKRVDWLRTALIDFGVPIALISTPQYFARACDKFLNGGWNANQIQRRLAHTVALPDSISAEEMRAVAKSYFPNASSWNIGCIVMAAATELGFLTVMQHLRKRVDFIAAKSPGQSEAACIDVALRDYPAATAPTPAVPVPASDMAPATRLQGPGIATATPVHPRAAAPVSLSRIHREEAQLTVS